jgi:hypothetical protein
MHRGEAINDSRFVLLPGAGRKVNATKRLPNIPPSK